MHPEDVYDDMSSKGHGSVDIWNVDYAEADPSGGRVGFLIPKELAVHCTRLLLTPHRMC